MSIFEDFLGVEPKDTKELSPFEKFLDVDESMPATEVPTVKPSSGPRPDLAFGLAPFVSPETAALMGVYKGGNISDIAPYIQLKRPPGIYAEDPDQTLWEKFRSWFHDPDVGKDRAANIVAMSELTGLQPMEVLRHYDELSSVFFPARIPGSKEMAVKALHLGMTGAIAKGMLTHPVITATAVAAFMGADEAINAFVSWRKKEPYLFQAGKGVSDLLEAEGFSRDAINVLEFIVEAVAAGGTTEVGRGIVGALLRGAKDKYSKINIINRIAKKAKAEKVSPDKAASDIAKEADIPKEVIERAQEKVEEVKSIQAELSRKEAEAKIDKLGDELIKEELLRQAEGIAREKMFEKSKRAFDREAKKAEKARQKLVKEGEKITAAKEVKKEDKIVKEEFEEPAVIEDLDTIKQLENRYEKDIDKISDKEIENFFIEQKKETKIDWFGEEKPEQVTEVDRLTGVEVPGLKDEKSPFFQDKEKAETFGKMFAGRELSVRENIEVLTQKLINDVNRWYHGDETVDITETRNTLSNLAAEADKFDREFISRSDHNIWKETVSEAAAWARNLDRSKIEQPTEYIEAYHGSKSQFDTFDIDRIGTGEGGAEAGIGINLISSKERASEYAETASGGLVKVQVGEDVFPVILGTLESNKDLVAKLKLLEDPKEIPGSFLYKIRVKNVGIVDWNDKVPSKVLDKFGIHASNYGDLVLKMRDRYGAQSRKMLADEGINGIKYEDATFEDAPEAYTIFNPDILEIVKIDPIYRLGIGRVKELGDRSKIERTVPEEYLLPKGERRKVVNISEMSAKKFAEKYPLVNLESPQDVLDRGGMVAIWDPSRPDIPMKLIESPETRRGRIKLVETTEKSLEDKRRTKKPKGGGPEGGTELYTGIPIDKAAKDILKGAKEFKESFEKILKAKDFKWSYLPKRIREEFTSAIIEKRGNLSREVLKHLKDDGFEIVHKMYLASGAPGRSKTHFSQLEKEVFSGLSKERKKTLFAIIDAKRMLDIGGYKTVKQYKFPKGRDPINAVKFLETLKKTYNLTDKEVADLNRKAKNYGEHIKIVIDKARESGLFGDREAVDLKSHFWRKIRQLEEYDPKMEVTIGNRKFEVRESGVRRLGEGEADRIIEGDAELLALEFFNRMYGRIMNNNALRTWLEVAEERPDNPLVWTMPERKLIPEIRSGILEHIESRKKALELTEKDFKNRLIKKFDAQSLEELSDTELVKFSRSLGGKRVKVRYLETDYPKKPKGYVRFSAWVGGTGKAKTKSIYLHPEIAKDMVTGKSKDLTYRAARAASYALLTPVLRFMATGAAPVWSTIVNFPIDVLTAWGSARYYEGGKWHRLYSSHFPIFSLQIGKDLVKVAKDAHTRGPLYKALAEHGALLSFLAQQARIVAPGERVPTKLSKFGDLWTRHSENMEMWTREAVANRVIERMAREKGITRKQAMKDKEIMDRAAFAARDYIDFNQGGWLIKAIDQALPYTNAGVQAGRVFWRQAKDDPAGFAYRMFQVGTLATLTTALGWTFNKETQSEIPLYARARNKTFALPDSFRFTDLDGAERGLFVKIPLPREIAMFNIFFETLTDQYLYSSGVIKHEPEYEAVFEAMKAGMPVDPTYLPPLAAFIQSYRTGKDMFTGRPATSEMLPWPYSKAEFTPGEGFKIWEDIGQRTGVSPDRISTALKQIFTDSIWGRIVGTGYEKLFSDLPDDMKKDNLFITLSKIPRISRVIGVTVPNARTREREFEIVNEEKLLNMIDGRAAEAWAKFAYWRGSKEALEELEKIKERAIERDYHAWERVNDKIEIIKNSADLPDRKDWLKLAKKPPEARAKILALRYNKADKEGKQKIWDGLSAMEGIGGLVTERFMTEFSNLIED